MKDKFLIPLLIGLAITAATIFGTYYYNRTVPDVRYTLSEPIPISFLSPNGNPESIQQLEIKNVGNLKSERVRVKITGHIRAYKLDPYSQEDKPNVFSEGSNFEIAYPELPPQGGFTVTVKAEGFTVNSSNLMIGDSTGPSRAALSKESSSGSFSWIFVAINLISAMVYWIVTAWKIKELNLDVAPMTALLRMRRPWYLTQKRWSKLFVGAITYKLERDYAHHAETSNSYQLLNTNRPKDLDESDWEEITAKASTKFKGVYDEGLRRSVMTSEVLRVMEMEKPRHLSETDWCGLLARSAKEFEKRATYLMFDGIELQGKLKSERPEAIDEETWARVKIYWRRELLAVLERSLSTVPKPTAFLSDYDLSVLDENSRLKLVTKAFEEEFGSYKSLTTTDEAKRFIETPKPDDIDEKRYLDLKQRAEKIIAIDSAKLPGGNNGE